MKRFKKYALRTLGVLVVLVLGLVVYIQLRWDRRYQIEGPDLKTSTDPAVIARGKYLVRGPAHCSNCHVASFDEMQRADKGEELPLKGGCEFVMGPLGVVHPLNITPCTETGIGRYSDRVVFRVMRNSIKPDGTTTMQPLMPFHMMADDDLIAVVSFLRAQAPIKNAIPEPKYTFMGKAVRTFAPLFKPVLGQNPPKTAPPEAPTRERGEYLARYVANCIGCHTKADMATGRFIGPEFAGGMEFEPLPGLPGVDQKTWYRAPNLTPDPATGIMSRFPDKKEWITRFRQGRVLPGTPMHWGPFSRMSDADLEALLVFFKSLAPIANEVGTTAFTKEG